MSLVSFASGSHMTWYPILTFFSRGAMIEDEQANGTDFAKRASNPLNRFVLKEVLNPVCLGHDGDAFFGHHEAAGAVLFGVEADHRSRRNGDSLVDNRAADAGMTADIDSF